MKKCLTRFVMSSFAVLIFSAGLSVFAEESLPPAASNPAFDRMKALAGDWQGKTINPQTGQEETMLVRYEVTSGGQMLMERIFAGTPLEMISVYYPEGQGVRMTHYCLLGNRPSLSLKTMDDKALTFEMEGTQGIASLAEHHMHGVTLTVDGKDKLQQDWRSFKDSKPSDVVTFNLTRQHQP